MFSRWYLLLAAVCIFSFSPASYSADTDDEAAERAKLEAWDKAHEYKSMRGLAFHFCSCSVPCPCMFDQKEPDDCTIVRVLHVMAGGEAGPFAVGKTLVLIPHPEKLRNASDGKRPDGEKFEMAIYVPEELSEDQVRKLRGQFDDLDIWIFGWASADIRPAKISFKETESGGYEVEVPGVFHAITEPLGEKKKPIIAKNLPLPEGSTWTIAKTKKHTFQDPKQKEWHWEMAEKNGSWTQFETHFIQR